MEGEQEEKPDSLYKQQKTIKELKNQLDGLEEKHQHEKGKIRKTIVRLSGYIQGVEHCLQEADKFHRERPKELEKLHETVEQKKTAIKNTKKDIKRLKRRYDSVKKLMEEVLTDKKSNLKKTKAFYQMQRSAQRGRTKETGYTKSWFNYLLLDSRVTKNLPQRKSLGIEQRFQTFRRAVFYIGKGQQARPEDHLHEAVRQWEEKKVSPKIKKIKDIWSSGYGIISINCFHHAVESVALDREAYMIEAIGLKQLTNEKQGTYSENTRLKHPGNRKPQGERLLRKACIIFLADQSEGEIQIRPEDIKPRRKRKKSP